MSPKYTVERCRCAYPRCRHWHVAPVAAMQGVCFTERQARAVAAVLEALESKNHRAGMLALIKWTRDQVADVSPDENWTNAVCDRLEQVSDVLEFRT